MLLSASKLPPDESLSTSRGSFNYIGGKIYLHHDEIFEPHQRVLAIIVILIQHCPEHHSSILVLNKV